MELIKSFINKLKIKHIMILILIFYVWIGTNGSFKFDLTTNNRDFYNSLSDSFLKGKLSLLTEPSRELLSLPDPYNPNLNRGLKLQDASLYKKKYYVYFGPTPVLTLFLPVRLIPGIRLPENLAGILFLFGGFVFASLLLISLQKKYFPEAPEYIISIFISVLGFANLAPYILRLCKTSEITVAAGLFFLMGALYFLLLQVESNNPRKRFLALGSLFLGLSVGCREYFILFGLILFIACFKLINFKKISLILATFIPFLFCLSFLGLYNYLRFENAFEFGLKYQLSNINWTTIKYINWQNIIPNLYLYLYHPFKRDLDFPFVHFNNEYLKWFPPPINPLIIENIVGVFTCIPFVLFLFICPILYWIYKSFNCQTNCFKNSIFLNSVIWWISLTFSIWFVIALITPLQIKVISQFLFLLKNLLAFTYSIHFLLLILICHILIWIININRTCDSICKTNVNFPLFSFSIIFCIFIISLLYLASCGFTSMRYATDFITPLILLTSITWFYFDSLFADKVKNWTRNITILFIVITVSIGASLEPLYGRAKNDFRTIEPLFTNIAKSIFNSISWSDVKSKTVSIPFTIETSRSDSCCPPVNLIDQNEDSIWTAGGSAPATLFIRTQNPSRIKKIWLLARQPHDFIECWGKVRATSYLNDTVQSTKEFSILNAKSKRVQNITLNSGLINKLELTFFDPVLVTLKGTPVEPSIINPGYHEILIEGTTDSCDMQKGACR